MTNVPVDGPGNEIRTERFGIVPFWVMDAAFEDRIKSSSLMVYCALLQFANSSRSCWPSAETLMKRAGVSRMTYRQAMRELQECGALVVVARKGGSNIFQLPSIPGLVPVRGGLEVSGGEGLEVSGGGGPEVSPRTISIELDPEELEPIELEPPTPSGRELVLLSFDNEPTSQPAALVPNLGTRSHSDQPTPAKAPRSSSPGGFEEFWSLTVHKKAPARARVAYAKAVGKVGEEVVLTAWARHNRIWAQWPKDQRRYIEHPSTWLNAESWDGDDPDPRGSASSGFAELAERWGGGVSGATYTAEQITGTLGSDTSGWG